MPTTNSAPPRQESIVPSDLDADQADLVSQFVEEHQKLRDEVERLREETVSTVVVKRVLLEYGISGEQLERIIEDIEAVDSQLWGEDDE